MAGVAQSDFASLLDELIAEQEDRAAVRGAVTLDYLSVADELSGRISISEERARAGYREAAEDDAPARPRMSPQAARSDPVPPTDRDSVARELGLGRRTHIDDLDRARREFAFRNHPDRVSEHLRAHAMIRMQIANTLIDEAKRSLLTRVRRR